MWESAESPFSEISLNKLMSSSSDELYGAADFISSRIWRGISIVGSTANLPDLNPIKSLWGIVKKMLRDTKPNNTDDLKITTIAAPVFLKPQQNHKLITYMPHYNNAITYGKETSENGHTF